MQDVPVTTMTSREYCTVFGFKPFQIAAEEHLVDIGSGNTDLLPLSRQAPDIGIIQIDPAYALLPQDRMHGQTESAAFVRIALEIGSPDKRALMTASKIAEILRGKAARVTSANTLRYLSEKQRGIAIAQMLEIADSGLVQIYPVQQSGFDRVLAVSTAAGIHSSLHRNGIAGIRQIAYGVLGLNNTLTLDLRGRNKPLYARERVPVAKQVASYILGR